MNLLTLIAIILQIIVLIVSSAMLGTFEAIVEDKKFSLEDCIKAKRCFRIILIVLILILILTGLSTQEFKIILTITK